MTNSQPAELILSYGGTTLSVFHDYFNIGISDDHNWINAAVALYNCMSFWHKDPDETWHYDTDLKGGPDISKVRIARLIMDWKNMEIYFDDKTEYGYDGVQYSVFQKLKNNFDVVKKIPAFL